MKHLPFFKNNLQFINNNRSKWLIKERCRDERRRFEVDGSMCVSLYEGQTDQVSPFESGPSTKKKHHRTFEFTS